MNPSESARNFDAYYYAHGCAAPYERSEALLAFFEGIAKRIRSDIQPGTVLDAGCALGFLVEALRKLDVQAFGVDVSEYAIQNVHPTIRPYCWTGSIADPLPQRYDLIISIEVLEHMPKPDAERAIANLCAYSDDIVFSSSPFDYKEVTHFNVQPPEYWAEQFARQGFVRDVDFDGSFITPWAARFRRSHEPLPSLVRAYERRFWLLWKENVDLRSQALEMRDQLSARERTLQGPSNGGGRENVELQQVLNSRTWRLAQKLQHVRLALAPHSSRREAWLRALGIFSKE